MWDDVDRIVLVSDLFLSFIGCNFEMAAALDVDSSLS
jgi:hypothetical protein